MGIGYYNTLGTLQAAGPSLSNSAVATSLLNPQAKIALPANFFAYIGQKLKIEVQGQFSNIVTTPGTFTFDVRFGSTVVFNGGAYSLSTTAHTTLPFWLDISLTVRAVGSSANLMGQGRVLGDSFPNATSSMVPDTTPAVGNNFDSTATQVVDLFGTFQTANSGNNVTVQQYEIFSCNWGG